MKVAQHCLDVTKKDGVVRMFNHHTLYGHVAVGESGICYRFHSTSYDNGSKWPAVGDLVDVLFDGRGKIIMLRVKRP